MPKYEIMYILDPKLEDFGSLKSKIELILKGGNGRIISDVHLGIRDLAYPIKKEQKGNYFLLVIETEPKNLEEFKQISRINKQILRLLILNTGLQKNYVQNTKLSATEVNEEEFTRRPNRRFTNRNFVPTADFKKNEEVTPETEVADVK